MANRQNDSLTESKRVVILCGVLNLILMAYKLVIGYIGNSSAVIADGVHSLSDFLTDIIVLIGIKVSQKPKDEDHPYGHGKVETFSSLFIALVLIVVAMGIFFSSFKKMTSGVESEPVKMITLTAVLLSIVVKEFLFRFTIAVGKRHNLNSLIANAWHHRSDVYSSIAAMAGVIGAMMGFRILDPIAAFVVALFIGKVGLDISREAFMDLIDTAAGRNIHDKIVEIVSNTSGVKEYHGLKTRKVGNKVVSDLQIKVDQNITVVEGHDIARAIKSNVIESISEVEDILIHIEPVGDPNGMSIDRERFELDEAMVKNALTRISGIKGIHSLKIHKLGHDIVINLDIEVEPKFTVAKGHSIAKEAKRVLFKICGNVRDVVIHIDPFEKKD